MINVDLDLLKTHLNIDKFYADEDEYLYQLFEVALRAIENHIDQPISNFCTDGQLEAPLMHAAMLLTATYYQNRESVSYGQALPVPHGYEYLLAPYVNYFSEEKKCDCCKK